MPPLEAFEFGPRVFAAIAALMGANALRIAMRELIDAITSDIELKHSVTDPAAALEHALLYLHDNRVLELDPSRSVDYFNRGKVLLELRRNEDAKEDFRRFLRLTNLPPDLPVVAGVGDGVTASAGSEGRDDLQGIERLFGVQLLPEDVYYITGLPTDLQASDVGTIACVALVMAFLATLYPAWRAARTAPAEALRYE